MGLPNKVRLMEAEPCDGLQHEPLVNGQPADVVHQIALIERPAGEITGAPA